MVPPNILRPGLGGLWKLFQLGRSFQKLGPGLSEAIEILTGAARPLLDRWFESEELKATLATDAIIGAFAAPSMPGTAYVLFHHVMGETNGKRGVWAYVKGGMGGLTQALAQAAKGMGVEIRCEAEVAKILTKDGTVTGVVLANGDEFHAGKVASNLDCRLTFTKLLDPKILPPDFVEAIGRINYDSASLKINVALSELPNFTACPGSARPAASRHRPPLPRSGLHRTRLRRRQVWPAVAGPDPRMHAALRGRSKRRPARQASHVDVHPVRSVQAQGRHLGRRPQEQVRRPLLRHFGGVRPRTSRNRSSPGRS